MPKEELLDEIGIPLTPVRLKCALLGLGVLKVALNKAKGTPLPGGVGDVERRDLRRVAMAEIDVCPLAELPPGTVRIVEAGAAPHDRGLQLRRRAVRARGPLLPRRRPAVRGRLRLRRAGRGLPAPRCPLRHRDGPRADASGVPPGRDVPGAACATTGWSSSRRRSTVEPHLPSSTADGIHSDLPRKGGGPDVTDSSSTGSGGTSG